jgi:phosphatidate cytidylyltransferase
MSEQGIVLLTLAGAFGFGAIAILAISQFARTSGLTNELWGLYRSEFIIVGALLVPAALGSGAFSLAALAFLARACLELVRLLQRQTPRIAQPAALAFAAILVTVLTGATVALRFETTGFLWIAYVYATVEIGDAMALLTGKLFGRTRILPRLSPRKTFEGFLGGFAFGGAAGYALAVYLLDLPSGVAAALTVFVLAAGLAGDLLASAFKRSYGVKDFPPVLARHGGFLDIYDSLLTAAPAAYLFRVLLAA